MRLLNGIAQYIYVSALFCCCYRIFSIFLLITNFLTCSNVGNYDGKFLCGWMFLIIMFVCSLGDFVMHFNAKVNGKIPHVLHLRLEKGIRTISSTVGRRK